KYGWKNHPAVRMWRGFTPALVRYGLDVCDAWEARGYADATRAALLAFTGGRVPDFVALRDGGQLPPWLGHDPVHVSHRSSLLRKDPEHYRRFFPTEPDDLPYVWPPAAFPRWPVRRGRPDPLPLATALGLLGLDDPHAGQAAAIAALQDGADAVAEAADTATGLLAGLCTRGATLWVTPDRPPLPVPDELPEPVRAAAAGRVSAPIAKPPTEADLAAMAAEAAAEPEFRFLPASAVTPAALDGVGLVVLDRVDRTALPELRVPVLALRAEPVSRTA
ncbi:MAG TPA: MSMEG_6728 family protein, partial [Mycobacteriales bacterium]|nr:MSMEG_6728 family protein [Mycobacteriales bacterium]